MPVTRKTGLSPLLMPSEAGELAAIHAATSTAKATTRDKPGPDHVRIRRNALTRGSAPGRVVFDFRAPVRHER